MHLLLFKKLSADLSAKVQEVFDLFDQNHSKQIDMTEAVNHWKSGFSKISAKEFFNQVDVNKDGCIEFDEFLAFWEVVKGSGHEESEILEELERIKNGESWVGFEDLPKQYSQKHH